MKKSLLALFCGLSLAGALAGQESAAYAGNQGAVHGGKSVFTHGLATARSIFARSDANGDGAITRAEAGAVGVAPREWLLFDADASGAVERDEFLVGYRQYVLGAGHRVAPELEAEAARLQALRRAQATEHLGPAARRFGPARFESANLSDDPTGAASRLRAQAAQDTLDAQNQRLRDQAANETAAQRAQRLRQQAAQEQIDQQNQRLRDQAANETAAQRAQRLRQQAAQEQIDQQNQRLRDQAAKDQAAQEARRKQAARENGGKGPGGARLRQLGGTSRAILKSNG